MLILKGILEIIPVVFSDVHDVPIHIQFILYQIYTHTKTCHNGQNDVQYSDVTTVILLLQ